MRQSFFFYLILFTGLISILSCSEQKTKTKFPEELSFPNLHWQPEPFVFKRGQSTRYIDFADGNDQNPGTREAPWKHHPWDERAKGRAAACKGIHTYVFKAGVSYRGTLKAKESGQPGNPIRLTYDPSWGSDQKAIIRGSQKITEGWKLCTPEQAPGIPKKEISKTWYQDIGNEFVPELLWMEEQGKLTRIPIAKIPNADLVYEDDSHQHLWMFTDEIIEAQISVESNQGFKVGDFVEGSGVWEDVNEAKNNISKGRNKITKIEGNNIYLTARDWKKGAIKKRAKLTNGKAITVIKGVSRPYVQLIDTQNLTEKDPKAYLGARVWAEGGAEVPQLVPLQVIDYDSKQQCLKMQGADHWDSRAVKYSRYFMENLPQFLDQPGEYYFSKEGKFPGRLYLRLPGDRDPNQSIVEIARHFTLLDLGEHHHIEVSGLSFRCTNTPGGKDYYRHNCLNFPALKIGKSCRNITIKHCEFSHLVAGLSGKPDHETKGIYDQVTITDNHFHDIDETAISLYSGWGDPASRIIEAKILRNCVERNGLRVWSAPFLGGHAIHVHYGELIEVAHNVVDRCGASGITVKNGKGKGTYDRPLIRVLIHHNKVTNSMLALQDWGGIASWQGGPSYVYNNISGNAVAYKNIDHLKLKRQDWYRTSCFGPAIYLDGQYKGYVFNNIMWGKNNNTNDRIYNAVGIQEAMGFMNTVFHNTIYRVGSASHKGMWQHNRSYYIGNLMIDIGLEFFNHESVPRNMEYWNIGYEKNIFHGTTPRFGRLGRENFDTLESWNQNLQQKQALVSSTGFKVQTSPVQNEESHDFRLKANSPAIDKGAKVFVPWGLYGVVGEWHFYENKKDPREIYGESIYMNEEWPHRHWYQWVQRFNLQVKGKGESEELFEEGHLENWVKGALRFDGKNTFCVMSDASLKQDYIPMNARRQKSKKVFPGDQRKSVDMDTNNFLIEVVFKIDSGYSRGGIVYKKKKKGYDLEVNEEGKVKLSLQFKDTIASRASQVAVNDGRWHHVIAEVDRKKKEGITLYIDGKLSNGEWEGVLPQGESLSNEGDFLVGKSEATPSGQFFKGSIDFLRVSRGTLEDAKTTIEELYDWQFNGPFLKDFSGRSVVGKQRDVGALERVE